MPLRPDAGLAPLVAAERMASESPRCSECSARRTWSSNTVNQPRTLVFWTLSAGMPHMKSPKIMLYPLGNRGVISAVVSTSELYIQRRHLRECAHSSKRSHKRFPIFIRAEFACSDSSSSATNKRSPQERLCIPPCVKRISPLVKCTLPAYITSATAYYKLHTSSHKIGILCLFIA